MATQQDLQELLRVFTARKLPMLAAMQEVKKLQAAGLRRSVVHVSVPDRGHETDSPTASKRL